MTMKRCSRCKKEKNLSEFNKNKSKKYGVHSSCRICHRKESKEYVEKSGYNRSLNAIYRRMKFRNGGTIDFNRKFFIKWYNDNNKSCYYCQIPYEILQQIEWKTKFLNGRNRVFAVDRKNNNSNYNKNNICLACDLCNNLKTDFFGSEEFCKIAIEYIKPRWQKLWQKKTQ